MTWDRTLINGSKLYSKLQMSKDQKKRESVVLCYVGLNDVQRTDGMNSTGQYKRHSFYPWDQMTPLQTTEQMLRFPTKFQQAAGMEMNNRKAMVLVLLLLLSQLACDAHSVSECCREPSRPCRLYVLLCRTGNKGPGGALTEDAAAGILTLGKRKEDEYRFQSRLQQLLQGSRNQAAGILTMGKRTRERAGEQYMDWMAQSGTTIMTPLPV